MKVGSSHLTYCTNIHAGESFAEVFDNVRRFVPRVRQRVAGEQAFGVGLRLSAEAAGTLAEPRALEEFRDFLNRESLYVFTLNGFPYGRFHGEPVKARVYEPDWTTRERVSYTLELANVLSQLLPGAQMGSISTVPIGFRPRFASKRELAPAIAHVLEVVAALERMERELGTRLVLALEPEPRCLLETTAEAELSRQTGADEAHSEAILRRHLGVCLDTCHAAVEFESADESLALLEGAGILIAKLQLSAGLRLATLSEPALTALRAFDEPVYLHQVVAKRHDDRLLRFDDLPQAFASEEACEAQEWRVHFHVPLYTERLDGFVNTQPYLSRILARHGEAPVTQHLEVETYTWDVLPAQHRKSDVVDSIARELDWVLEKLK